MHSFFSLSQKKKIVVVVVDDDVFIYICRFQNVNKQTLYKIQTSHKNMCNTYDNNTTNQSKKKTELN